MSAVEILFQGGAVFTGSGEPVVGRAVGVSGGRIVAVVPDAEAAALIGAHTQVIELDGALLAPGFQDAHIHPAGGGVEMLTCDLSGSEDAEDSIARVKAYFEANPGIEWIGGGGWSMDHFPGGAPVRALLDAIVPDVPVLLNSRDHHSAWANSAAIALAGITAETPDPADGKIEREADGTPAGTFHEGAEALFADVRPIISADVAYAGLLAAQDALIALGITGWQDAMIGGAVSGVEDLQGVYERAVREGTLRAHVVGAQWWERSGGIEQVEQMRQRREAVKALGHEDRFSLGTVKIMVDGVAENQTAAMLTPYRDSHGHITGNSGLSFVDPELLREIVAQLDADDFQVHFHALGDRAVKEALDALDAARAANGETDGRHHLAHLQVVDESDTGRFAPLGAVANIQALWATHEDQLDELTLPFLREGAVDRQYPFGDLVRDGARLAAGSDWPVSSANPIEAIHVAVNRVFPGGDTPPLGGAHQRLSLADAMAAYTSGTAYVNHRDSDTGSVREGYIANLVVIEPNPFSLPQEEIYSASVVSTWIDGTLAFSRND
ncbi:amidohydrolase [Microterricola viridarii]|uniref:Amidohydrolase n=1 Tax=Microterricola viridarii TaxID=412690 RepID=A0A120I126_9MICO|nr:amidohydrolase [Microterricola viridarii]AMB59072.1 amidohydrolase [Microterricola viridarii]